MSSALHRQILGWLIMKPSLLEIGNLSSNDFPAGRLRQTFEIISAIWEEDRPDFISVIILAEKIGGDGPSSFIDTLTHGLQAPNAESFATVVRRMKRRGLSEKIVSAAEELGHIHLKTGVFDDKGLAELRRLILKQDELENPKKTGSSAVLRRLSEIEPRPVEWTWPNRIPRGKLSLVVGDPGLGKSFLCIDLAARISTGQKWPDLRESAAPGSTLLLTAEDGLADTVRIRADSAGADVSKLIVLEAVKVHGEMKLFSLDEHLNVLENVIKENGDLALIVIDPLSAFLGDLDSHKNAEIRGALAPLSALAERSNVSIIGVSHLNKSTASEKAVYRVMGSLSFVAAARACWGVIIDPEDEEQERRLIVPVKTNLSVKPTSLSFKIDNGRIVYDSQAVQVNADEAFSSKREDREQRSIAEKWLRDVLQTGPRDVKDIMKQAREEAIPESSIYRASQKLGVMRSRKGFGGSIQSVWEIPA